MKLNITAIADRMIWFITLIFLVLSLTISFALGDANYGAYVLFVCLFGLIIFYLIREQGVIKFRLTWMHGYMLLFIGAYMVTFVHRRRLVLSLIPLQRMTGMRTSTM